MLATAVAQTQGPGSARIDSAIGNRNSDENGFSTPPLQAIIQVSEPISTSMCANTTASLSSSLWRARHVAYTLNAARAPMPAHNGTSARASCSGPVTMSTVNT